MAMLLNEHLTQQAGYQEHQDYLNSIGVEGCIKHRTLAKHYCPLLANFPYQHCYEMKVTSDAGILRAKTGEVLEFPKAIFAPAFNLRAGSILRGEISAWIEVLDTL